MARGAKRVLRWYLYNLAAASCSICADSQISFDAILRGIQRICVFDTFRKRKGTSTIPAWHELYEQLCKFLLIDEEGKVLSSHQLVAALIADMSPFKKK